MFPACFYCPVLYCVLFVCAAGLFPTSASPPYASSSHCWTPARWTLLSRRPFFWSPPTCRGQWTSPAGRKHATGSTRIPFPVWSWKIWRHHRLTGPDPDSFFPIFFFYSPPRTRVLILYLYVQYYSVICHPSDHTVGRPRAEIWTRDGQGLSPQDHHASSSFQINPDPCRIACFIFPVYYGPDLVLQLSSLLFII